MSSYNNVIQGIVAEIEHEDGYRLKEKPLSLEAHCGYEKSLLVKSTLRGADGGDFTHDDSVALNNKGLSLGIIVEPVPFPELKNKNPNITWKTIDGYDRRDYESYSESYLVGVDEKNELIDIKANKKPKNWINQYIDIKRNSELSDHLKSGYCAYILIKDSKAWWLDVPNYFLLPKWVEAVDDYRRAVQKLEYLDRSIKKSEELNRALEQEFRLANLPFKWSVGVREVKTTPNTTIVSLNEAYKTTHLILNEELEVEDNGLLLDGDFLCLAESQVPRWENEDCRYICQVQGMVVKRVWHEITCKECLQKIDQILHKNTVQK